jgi:hypothetical protein
VPSASQEGVEVLTEVLNQVLIRFHAATWTVPWRPSSAARDQAGKVM